MYLISIANRTLFNRRQDNKRIFKISTISYVLAIFIVVMHVSLRLQRFLINLEDVGNLEILTNCSMAVFSFAVPMYFLISGFLFFNNYTKEKAKEKVASRIFSLGIPFVIWNIFCYLIRVSMSYIPVLNLEEPTENIIEAIWQSSYSPLWFLRSLGVMIVISPILYYLIKNKIIGMVFMIALTILSLVGFDIPLISLYYLPIFIFGGYMALHYKALALCTNRESKYKVLFLAFFVILVLVACFVDFGKYQIVLHIYRFAMPIVFWVVADSFFDFQKSSKWYVRYDFLIYCTHTIILDFFTELLLVLPVNSYGLYFLQIFLPIILVLFITTWGYFWNKYSPRSLRFAIGGR